MAPRAKGLARLDDDLPLTGLEFDLDERRSHHESTRDPQRLEPLLPGLTPIDRGHEFRLADHAVAVGHPLKRRDNGLDLARDGVDACAIAPLGLEFLGAFGTRFESLRQKSLAFESGPRREPESPIFIGHA